MSLAKVGAKDVKDKDPGIFAITDKRVIHIYHAIGADEFEEIPIDHISAFQSSKGLIWGAIKIISSVIPFDIEIPRKVYDVAVNILSKVIPGK